MTDVSGVLLFHLTFMLYTKQKTFVFKSVSCWHDLCCGCFTRWVHKGIGFLVKITLKTGKSILYRQNNGWICVRYAEEPGYVMWGSRWWEDESDGSWSDLTKTCCTFFVRVTCTDRVIVTLPRQLYGAYWPLLAMYRVIACERIDFAGAERDAWLASIL